MEAIDRGSVEIALVVDSERRLLGTLTDGDLRRALLRGLSLDDQAGSAMNTTFVAVRPDTGRAEVLDLMRARTLQQIPVIDSERRLIGLHVMREVIGAVARPNWALVMAGGRGERLRPITDSLPKPMIKVAGRPILERLVLHLIGFGIRQVFLSVNYKSEMIEEHFGDGSALGCQVSYLKEETALGTGGALSLLPDGCEHPLVVLNGDLLTQVDIGAMLAFHSNGAFKATVAVHDYVHTVPYGVVECDGQSITALREKPMHSWLANAGIYVVQPELIGRVPKQTYFAMPSLIEECFERREPVGAFRIESEWADVGRVQELRRARGEGEIS